jgi:signal transduction histidine kinase
MTERRFSFRANIRLKDIIGQGLINNSNIAIIELIKNAKDAGSPSVELLFENAGTENGQSTITIRDAGHGMSRDEVADKWLNIAYSEKRVGRKPGNTHYAGEKGIGRFSCDRLGKKLDLYSRKKDERWAHLHVYWPDFEVDDPDLQISDVDLRLEQLSDRQAMQNLEMGDRPAGTTLVIRDLRETWGEVELRKLQKELERFVIDPNREFTIHFKSLDFVDPSDKLVFDGFIENKLLSKIDGKTLAIFSEITPDGSTINNRISHLGDTILSFEMDNPYDHLRDIKVQIHYLSQAAKVSFKNITGYTSADYGSIMLFLNGFRVMPYGEPKDDWLQLNERKNQGTSRHLGTRELFGLVEIKDNSRSFVPVSSREGLAHNPAFSELTDDDLIAGRSNHAYLATLVRTLEKYVVDGMDWDRIAPENATFSYEDILAAVNAIVKTSAKTSTYRNIRINQVKLRSIAQQKVVELKEFVADLLERVADKQAYELTKSEKRDLKRYVERHEGTLAARADVADVFKEKATVETKKRLFAESHLTADSKRIEEMQHLIGLWSGRIEDDIGLAMKLLSEAKPDSGQILHYLGNARWLTRKVSKLSSIITRANFDLMSDDIVNDVFGYIEEYINDIKGIYRDTHRKLSLAFENHDQTSLTLNFSPLEISMLVDNAIANSIKAGAKAISVHGHSDNKFHYLEFRDDGSPLTAKYPAAELFNPGVTTTTGSGIGLSHVRAIVQKLDGTASIFSNEIGGTTLQVRWDK